jgi:hypothetical protein
MKKLSSEALDFYDDPNGVVFKKRFPDLALLPDFVKEAKLLSEEDRETLPDDLFALVLEEGGGKLKKYAMNDKANTALSIIYFLDNGVGKIPGDIAKVAAQRLVEGCHWYQIQPPEPLVKAAESEDYDGTPNPNVETEKVASLSATVECKIMGLPEDDLYPLDSYRDTQTAVDFFEKHASRLHPRKRRTFARNIQKRAADLGIPTSQQIMLYASEQIDLDKTAQQVRIRMQKTAGMDRQRYAAYFEKVSSVSPGVAAEALAVLDEESGLSEYWDGGVLDPYMATLGMEKDASYIYHDNYGTMSDEDIKNLALRQQLYIEKALGKDFFKTFKEDPVTIFKSLPNETKTVLIRLNAADNLS